jgi:hypothetical protein
VIADPWRIVGWCVVAFFAVTTVAVPLFLSWAARRRARWHDSYMRGRRR